MSQSRPGRRTSPVLRVVDGLVGGFLSSLIKTPSIRGPPSSWPGREGFGASNAPWVDLLAGARPKRRPASWRAGSLTGLARAARSWSGRS